MTEGSLLVSGLVSGTEYFLNIRAINTGNLISGIGSSNGITYLNPAEDPDGDGSINEVEVAEKSDPFNPYSIPGESRLTLKKGFNLVSFPAEALYYEDGYTFMQSLGGSEVLSRMLIFDPDGQSFDEIGFDEENNLYGQNTTLMGGKDPVGMIIYAKQDRTFIFSSTYCQPWHFSAGINLVGAPCASGLKAFQLIESMGGVNVVDSIQRFNRDEGRFETSVYHDGQPSGVDFTILSGEGYFATTSAIRNAYYAGFDLFKNYYGSSTTEYAVSIDAYIAGQNIISASLTTPTAHILNFTYESDLPSGGLAHPDTGIIYYGKLYNAGDSDFSPASALTNKYPDGVYTFSINLSGGASIILTRTLSGTFPTSMTITSPVHQSTVDSLTPTFMWTGVGVDKFVDAGISTGGNYVYEPDGTFTSPWTVPAGILSSRTSYTFRLEAKGDRSDSLSKALKRFVDFTTP